jgi:hypothetical protein
MSRRGEQTRLIWAGGNAEWLLRVLEQLSAIEEEICEMDRRLIARCGAYCGDCEWKEKMNCVGCQMANGNMFWGECRVARCSIEKGIEHCGLCSSVPCDMLQEAFDHPEHGDNGERLANLTAWARGEDSYVRLGTFLKG